MKGLVLNTVLLAQPFELYRQESTPGEVERDGALHRKKVERISDRDPTEHTLECFADGNGHSFVAFVGPDDHLSRVLKTSPLDLANVGEAQCGFPTEQRGKFPEPLRAA